MASSVRMETPRPLTGLAWASGQPTCPQGYSMLVATTEGASANFVKGFNQKSAMYLCCSSTQELQSPLEQVVAEIQILNEKTPLPPGFTYIAEYLDPKVSISKKKRLCIKQVPLNTADQAVCEVKLTMKNKQIGSPYQRIGEMSGLALWCRMVSSSLFKPVPKPRSIVTGVRGLSLDSTMTSQPTTTNLTPKSASVKYPPTINGRSTESTTNESSNVYGISAIDGIPFTIHPMFENNISKSNVASSNFTAFPIKTLSDIENEYNYGFVVERSASTRMPSGVC